MSNVNEIWDVTRKLFGNRKGHLTIFEIKAIFGVDSAIDVLYMDVETVLKKLNDYYGRHTEPTNPDNPNPDSPTRYVRLSDLADYAKTEDLKKYITKTSLPDELDEYVQRTELHGYTPLSALKDYVKFKDLPDLPDVSQFITGEDAVRVIEEYLTSHSVTGEVSEEVVNTIVENYINSLDLRDGKDGVDGRNGVDGADGMSAYDIWISLGNTGTEADFLHSIRGADGERGDDGKSAYDIAVENGFVGDETTWLNSLKGRDGQNGRDGESIKGDKGDQGERGLQGESGKDGLSAYELAVAHGFEGNEIAFLASLKGERGSDGQSIKGDKGDTGLSAYDIWLAEGNTGTTHDFLASLKGEKGDKGNDGNVGEIDMSEYAKKTDFSGDSPISDENETSVHYTLSTEQLKALRTLFDSVVYTVPNGKELTDAFFEGFGLKKPSLLPEGYTKVSCVITDGNISIPTDIAETDYYGVEYTIRPEEDAWDTLETTRRTIHIFTSKNIYAPALKVGGTYKQIFAKYYTDENNAAYNWEKDAPYTITHTMTNNGNGWDNTLYINGEELKNYSISDDIYNNRESDSYFLLFGCAFDNIPRFRFSGKFYDLKVFKEDGGVFAHLIPCYNSENQVGLYDIVRNKFYYNENLTYESEEE